MRHVFIVLVAASLSSTAPRLALAHAELDHATPKVGSTVRAAPKEVVLWFTEELEPAFSSAEVRDSNGRPVTAGKPKIGGNRMQVPLKALEPGTYKVNWRVLSVDTHRTQGGFSFRVGP